MPGYGERRRVSGSSPDFNLKLTACLFLACVGYSLGQQTQSSEGTRQLYYLATSPKDSLPPVKPAAATASAPAPNKAEAPHLGLRYNLVLVEQSGHRRPIASDRILHTGDCVGVDLHANRSGYVYVFAKQSNGDWIPLLPSAEMPEEHNILDPGRVLRIPKEHCFRIENPPGEETLFVVLSRNPSDFYELYESYKNSSGQRGPVGARAGQRMQLADGSQLKAAVEHLKEEFGTRNISITKVDNPHGDSEQPGSVYVVNTSDRPTSSIVAKITIRHR